MNRECLRSEDIRFAYSGSSWSLEIPAWQARRGELVAMVGRNGSGKSTLLRLLAGVTLPQQGRIAYNETTLSDLPADERARRIAYLPQSLTPLYSQTVWEVVCLGRYAHGNRFRALGAQDKAACEQALLQVELYAYRHRPLSHLSGGEQRRAFLASVLAQEPQFLILDEPAAMLDMHHQVQLFRLFAELRTQNIGVILSVHDLNLASFYADRMVVLDNGRIYKEGTPKDIVREDTIRHLYGADVRLLQDCALPVPAVLPTPPAKEARS